MRRILILGLAAAGLIAAIAVLQHGDDHSRRIRAEFRDIEGIRKGYWVRVDGTRVGDVEDVQVTPRDTAIVTMKLDSGAGRFGAGARADVRPANLLGEKYIQLSRGTTARPLPDNATIPLARTGVAVELDDLLDTLEPGVRGRLRILINEIGIALGGNGANFNAMLSELPSTVDGGKQVVAQIASENRRLGELIDRADVAIGPVHAKREDVGALISRLRDVLRVTADHHAELASTIRSAPAALHSISSALDRLNASASALLPDAPLLRQAAPQLAATLDALPEFASSLRRPLVTARTVAPTLTRLGTRGTGAVTRLRPTVSRLAGFSDEIAPLVYTLGRAGGVDGVLGILNNWSKAASYKDGLSHYFDFHASVSPTTLDSIVDRFALSQTATAKAQKAAKPSSGGAPPVAVKDAGKKASDGVAQATKKAPSGVAAAVSKLTTTLQQHLAPSSPPPDEGATGGAVNGLLDFLLKP